MIAEVALKEARAIVSQEALSGRIDLRQFIEVRDRAGKLIYRINFSDAVTVG